MIVVYHEKPNNIFWTKYFSKIKHDVKKWCEENSAAVQHYDNIGEYYRFTIIPNDYDLSITEYNELILNFSLQFVNAEMPERSHGR